MKLNERDRIIAFTMFLAGVSCFSLLYCMQPLLPLLAKTFDIPIATSGLTMSMTTVGMAIGLFLAMFTADRIGRKRVIVSSLFLASFFAILSAFATSFFLLVLLSTVKGFVLAGTASVSLAYINEEVTPNNKGKITGLYIAGGSVGGMIGRVMSAHLGMAYSWGIATFSVGAVCLLFVFIILQKSPWSVNFTPVRKTFRLLFVSNIQLFKDSILLSYCFIGALTMGVFVSIYNYVGFYLNKSPFLFPLSYIKNIYLLYILGLIGTVSIGTLYMIFSKNRLLLIVIFGVFFGLLFLYIPSMPWVTIGLGFITFGFFITHTVCSYLISNIKPEKRSVSIAVYLLLYYAMASFWGWFSGVVLEVYGWQYFLSVLLLIMAFVLFLLHRIFKVRSLKNINYL